MRSSPGDNPPASDNLYVKGLPGWMTESDVEALFSEVGDIQRHGPESLQFYMI